MILNKSTADQRWSLRRVWAFYFIGTIQPAIFGTKCNSSSYWDYYAKINVIKWNPKHESTRDKLLLFRELIQADVIYINTHAHFPFFHYYFFHLLRTSWSDIIWTRSVTFQVSDDYALHILSYNDLNNTLCSYIRLQYAQFSYLQ